MSAERSGSAPEARGCVGGALPVRLLFELEARKSASADVEREPVVELEVPDLDSSDPLLAKARSRPAALPVLAEPEIARHYARLAARNYSVDTGFYPLGSCTMKYNPRINEQVARLKGLTDAHPYLDEYVAQGLLGFMFELQEMLAEIAGMSAVTLQPSAGAHGELTALLCIRAYHADNGNARRRVIIPDTAHGTNPATVSMAGYEATQVPSDARGGVDVDALRSALGPDVAAIMLTNPNTLGLFDENVCEITRLVHEAGALAFCDGANMNAILGRARPGDMGFDALHLNLHKTFGTPHGGGGPGAGPVAVGRKLAPYLPAPVVHHSEDGLFRLKRPSKSIGRMRSFYGNVGVLVRAYAYIRALGADGLREVADQAVLSANYLMRRLEGAYDLPYQRTCMHEFVLSGRRQKREHGVRTLDIAKRLLDYGIHPPTVYFPLVVDEAIMIEPTETESLDALDDFAAAMLAIAEEAAIDPDLVRGAPYSTPVRRLDEARAAKHPDLAWKPPAAE